MPFILTGFRHDCGFRVFVFESRDAPVSHVAFTVKADLTLIRRYGIRLQELPLLCRGLLERRKSDGTRALTFTEDEMRACADSRAADRDDQDRKKRPWKKPLAGTRGAAWR